MRNMLKHIFPKTFFHDNAYFRALTLGGLYVALALLQLFTFEKFGQVIVGYGMGGGKVFAAMLAGAIPLVEISALPYLLSMKLMPWQRQVSRVAVILTPVLWFVIALWLNLSRSADQTNTGLFGATLPTLNGIWLVLFAACLLWAAWLVVRELPSDKSNSVAHKV